jgi:tRNA threonylcarbamoyl adenosine modification protein YeaZ
MGTANSDILLAIESAIAGGSVALMRGSQRIDGIIGASGQSRAEDLLLNIDELLKRNELDKTSIKKIIVAAGPGSFTGIRIGIATAIGLAAALRIEVKQVSTLAAIAMASEVSGPVLAALPVGRDTICTQTFNVSAENAIESTPPDTISTDEFRELNSNDSNQPVVMNNSLYELLPTAGRSSAIDVGSDLAQYLGRFEAMLPHMPEPIFIGKRK